MKKLFVTTAAAFIALSTSAFAAEVRLPSAGQDGDISQTNRVNAAVAKAKVDGTSVKEAAANANGRNGTSGPGQQR